MIFTDLEQLYAKIDNSLFKALEKTMREVAMPKLKEFIERDVYNEYSNTWTGRTEEFADAWVMSSQKGKQNRINGRFASGFQDGTIEIYISDSLLSFYNERNENNDIGSHQIGNAQALAEIINNGLNGIPPMNFPAIKARPYWDDFVEWLHSDEFQDEFVKMCASEGVPLTKTISIFE